MCGIAGFSTLTRQVQEPFETLNRMAYRMRNRGPDAYGSWLANDSTIGMAHRRLSIIDPNAKSDQPMHLPDSSLSIVFNGEIYNFMEQHSISSSSSTTTQLHGQEVAPPLSSIRLKEDKPFAEYLTAPGPPSSHGLSYDQSTAADKNKAYLCSISSHPSPTHR